MSSSHESAHDRLEEMLRLGEHAVALRQLEPTLGLTQLGVRLGTSSSSVYRAVRLLELCARVGERWIHLGPSHLTAVLHAPPGTQEVLLQRAELERWTVRQLLAAVAAATPSRDRPSRGRPRQAPIVRTLRDLCRIGSDPEAFVDIDALDGLSGREVARLLEGIDQVVNECRTIQAHLREIVTALSWRSGRRGVQPSIARRNPI